MHRLQVFHLSGNFILRLYDVLELLKLLSFCLGGFVLGRWVSQWFGSQSPWCEVSVQFSFVSVRKTLVCLKGLCHSVYGYDLCCVWASRLELCALCAEIQWALFGVSGYLSELDIKPLMFLAVRSLSGNGGFGRWQIWFQGLEPDMLTVCCWAYQLSPGISVCIIINTVGPVRVLQGTCAC